MVLEAHSAALHGHQAPDVVVEHGLDLAHTAAAQVLLEAVARQPAALVLFVAAGQDGEPQGWILGCGLGWRVPEAPVGFLGRRGRRHVFVPGVALAVRGVQGGIEALRGWGLRDGVLGGHDRLLEGEGATIEGQGVLARRLAGHQGSLE